MKWNQTISLHNLGNIKKKHNGTDSQYMKKKVLEILLPIENSGILESLLNAKRSLSLIMVGSLWWQIYKFSYQFAIKNSKSQFDVNFYFLKHF